MGEPLDFLYFALYLPYFALHFTLNVRILSGDQSAEVIDGGKTSDFFQSPKKIVKNDVSSVRENSKNTVNASLDRAIELRIFLSSIFPQPGMDLPAARDLLVFFSKKDKIN